MRFDPARLTPEALRREIARVEAHVRRAKAPRSLIDFAQFTSPDPTDPDGFATTYEIAPHHAYVAQKLDDLFHGRLLKLAVSLPPRGGKTELGARRFIPWWLGQRPRDHIIFATYNETFAGEIGGEVRDVLHGDEFHRVFPRVALDMSSQSTSRLALEGGGRAIFVGRGGALTGRGFDLGIVDDLIKDADEAESPTLREQAWRWFTRTFLTRRMRHDSRILVIGTRWHEDDVLGRLTDPRNPCYSEDEAKTWTILRIPAISEGKEVDPLGRDRGEALWATRFPAAALNSMKRLDPQGFASLYQGKPTPDEGAHFKREMLKTYTRDNAPSRDRLRFYCASDHAVGTKQRNDPSCLLTVGVDQDDNVFVMPELVWKRMPADEAVNEMIRLMRTFNPLFWWAESGHISKSIGPFLHKRMQEQRVYCAIEEVTPSGDKKTRSQAIHGRMAMGKVFFPSFAPWWPDAMHEMLTFSGTGSAHDDFCLTGDTRVSMADGSSRRLDAVEVGDLVATPAGPRRVTAARMTARGARVFRVTFSDGRTLVGTGNHPVFVWGKGYVRLDALTHGDVVFSVNGEHTWRDAALPRARSSNTKGIATGGIQTALGGNIAFISTRPSPGAASFTATFGKTLTGLFRRATTYTTATATLLTTISRTLSACLWKSTVPSTCLFAAGPRSIWLGSPQFGPPPRLGTVPTKAAHGTRRTASAFGKTGSPSLYAAINAATKCRRSSPESDSAATPALSVTTIESAGTAEVFNLTVEGEHVYFANGVLTHNCDTLSLVGLKLRMQVAPSKPKLVVPQGGILTGRWVVESSRAVKRDQARRFVRANWG